MGTHLSAHTSPVQCSLQNVMTGAVVQNNNCQRICTLRQNVDEIDPWLPRNFVDDEFNCYAIQKNVASFSLCEQNDEK